jgi:transposase
MATDGTFSGELLTGEAAVTARRTRGMEIAALFKLTQRPDGDWVVPSQVGKGRYTVRPGNEPHCTCPDHELRGQKCKHIYAVEFTAKREETQNADGSTTVTETVTVTATKKTTYAQDWPAYNAAQVNEQDEFLSLLNDLCAGIPNPPQGKGRPRLPLSDALFAVNFKIYSTFSGRRFMSDLRGAQSLGYIRQCPHYNSIFNYLENPELTPVLRSLIIETSRPLAAIETDFAADSSGFTTSRFVRWFDHKYNTVRAEHDWVKVHICCGVKTNVVTAVEILDRLSQDSPILPTLLETTAQNFTLREVSADKGYSSINNVETVAKMGAVPYIAFKAGHTGKGGGMWEKMFHYFNFKRDEFLAHYHKRSNVETTFSMVKAKFGDAVRSKTDVAMQNEALCKFICHNICCLISAIYELGLRPVFWQPQQSPALLPN